MRGAGALLPLPLLALLLGACVTSPRPQLQPPGSTAASVAASPGQAREGLRVATLNMLHGWPCFDSLDERLDLIAAGLQEVGADVVLLQEVPVRAGAPRQALPFLAEKLGCAFVYARANGSGAFIGFEEGEAVLSRFPILSWEAHRLRPSPGPFERRIVLRAALAAGRGPLEVYSVHLSDKARRGGLRLGQVQDLIGFVQKGTRDGGLPAVVGGDFNCAPGSPPYRLFAEAGFTDAAVAADPPALGPTSGLARVRDPGGSMSERIDFLFLSPGPQGPEAVRAWNFLDAPRGSLGAPLWASDHAGVACDLAFP